MENIKNIQWPGWEVVRLIGRGSFGAVYEIQRDLFGKKEKAALKHIGIPQNPGDVEELYSDGYDDESITATFQSHLQSIVAEYSLMRKLNGASNVVNCDDVQYVQRKDGFGWDIYIKMELLTPLTKALPEQIPTEMTEKLARDMCQALVLCKRFDIVHRDIKPQNIFVSPLGDYKLGDFGIAKTVEKTMGGTKTGTYKYMAPEVYHNQPYGHQADIYSLGLVLYWMLNKKRMPFMPLPPAKPGAGMDEQTRNRRLSGEQIPPPADGSAELKRIVLKACAYDPKERYHTAEEMLADLEAIGSGKAPRKETPAETGPAFFPADRPEPEQAQDATVGAFRGYGRPEERQAAPAEEMKAAPSAESQAAPEPVKDYAAEEGTVGVFGRRENVNQSQKADNPQKNVQSEKAAAPEKRSEVNPRQGGRNIHCRNCGTDFVGRFCPKCGLDHSLNREQPPAPAPAPTSLPMPGVAPSRGFAKVVNPMVMMIISLSIMTFSLFYFYISVGEYLDENVLLIMLGYHLLLLSGQILMLIGAIKGSRGKTLFGVGLLLSAPVPVINALVFYSAPIYILVFSVVLCIGFVLAGIGCLVRHKGLRVSGSITTRGCFGTVFVMLIALDLLYKFQYFYVFGSIISASFAGLAALLFPSSKPAEK